MCFLVRCSICLLLIIVAGCTSSSGDGPSLHTLILERIPTGVWHIVNTEGRAFAAWRTGETPDVLWVVIDGQERAITVACRDIFADATAEGCELLAEKKPLPPALADQIYLVAIERIVGIPSTGSQTKREVEPRNLALTPSARDT